MIHKYLPCSLQLQFSSVQSLSRVRLFATPWIAARQASLSITNSQSSLRLTSIESVMPSSHLILCHPLLLLPPIPPSIRVFSNESTLPWGGQSTGVSALASFFPKKSQGWSPLRWTGWISLQSKGLSRVSSNTPAQKYQFFGAQLSSSYRKLKFPKPRINQASWSSRFLGQLLVSYPNDIIQAQIVYMGRLAYFPSVSENS